MKVISEGALPNLAMNKQSYYIDHINNAIEYINSKAIPYKIGQIISLSNQKHTTEDIYKVYSLGEWKLKVYRENISSIQYLSCLVVGIEQDTLFAILIHSNITDQPPICCRAKCMHNFGCYSLLRYKKWYFFVRDVQKQLVEENYFYLSTSFDITDYGIVVRHAQFVGMPSSPIYLVFF